MMLAERGGPTADLSAADLDETLRDALHAFGNPRRVIAVPPDITRLHSRAGELTRFAWNHLGSRLTDILPALGTHTPMTRDHIHRMFGDIPVELFRVHDWRNDVETLGEVPAAFLRDVSGGAVDYAWPAQVNRLIARGGHDLILSIGQVVPHEVIGMAGHMKNIFVGTGGPEGISRSHFLGAAYGMERLMGRADTPVRRVLDQAAATFTPDWPVVHVLTVVAPGPGGRLFTRGIFIGTGRECFLRAAELSLKVNFMMVEAPLRKVVVNLDPLEFKSTWLGNKSVYRTRMAIADGGELIVLAPGLREFGEDPEIDRLIRAFGYAGTPAVMDAVRTSDDLRRNLSAAAHLIHGSSEGRFSVTYCPGHLSRREIESVHFAWADLAAMLKRYPPGTMRDGVNVMPDGEEVFYISNPALGLWAHRDRFVTEGSA